MLTLLTDYLDRALKTLGVIRDSQELYRAVEEEKMLTEKQLLILEPPHEPLQPPTPGDGNCFFHARNELLPHLGTSHHELRVAMCSHIEKSDLVRNPLKFNNFHVM